MADSYFGYKVRKELYPGEDEYFKGNAHVSGMAADDGNIVFNPYSQGVNFDAVGQNEAARLWLRQNKIEPQFDITPEQRAYFAGTPYEKDELAMKHTILGRLISGDPSAGIPTLAQKEAAGWLKSQLQSRK